MYRIMGGLGVGVASMASPLYISEISPARIRGRMVALYQFAITLGILVAYFANAWLLQYSTTNPGMAALGQKVFVDEVWRGMFGSEVLPALLFLITMLLVPFSPRWLAAGKKDAQALKVLKRINNVPGAAEQELASIREALARESKGTWSVLWQQGIRVAVFAGIALALLCQFTGINAIIYYGPRIMEEAGLQLSDALGGQVLIGMVNAGATVIAILTIDRLGRKKLMKAGTAGMFVSLLVVGVLFFTGQTQGSLLLTFILLFIFCFAFGYGPVFWVLLAEIYPTRIRGRAMSVATFALWGATALIGQLVPWMLETLSPAGTFFVFAVCCIPVFFVLRLVPETKERSLEEIEMLWGRKG